jgi:hypothetical protein
MKAKLIPCKSCGQSIAKSATTCPQCGKKFSSVAGILLACLIGLAIGGLLIARTCSQASDADERMDEIQRELKAR